MKDRIAFVTGASQGIGRACAIELARAGAYVFAAARQQDKLAELVREITTEGGQCDAVSLDVTSRESIDAAFAQAKDKGVVSILVNNAGITRDGLAVRMSSDNWQKVLDTDGLVALIQGGVPMVRRSPGTWMHDALSVRDKLESRLLHIVPWSPLH